jgi:NDP-mannose synthase
MPILEILLRQLRSHGVVDVTVLTGHLAYLLEGYFGDGTKLGMSVDYIREAEPLGTAGPLRQLVGRVDDDFFVMNGDLLTDIDFRALMKRHKQKPTLHVNVSMGIYAMSPRVLVRIPDGHYDMPNLILDLLAAGEPVASWHHDGRWLDIGRPDDYDHANDLFRQFPDTLLPEQRAEGD